MAVVMQFLPVEETPKGSNAIPLPIIPLCHISCYFSLGKGKQLIKKMFTDDEDEPVAVIKVGPWKSSA